MNKSIAGLIISFKETRWACHAHHGDGRGQLGHGDTLPGPGDEWHRARWQVHAVDDTAGHVTQEDGLQRHRIAQELLKLLVGQAVEGLVGGGEDGERAWLGEQRDQVGRLDEGDEGGELGIEYQQVKDGADQVTRPNGNLEYQ